MQQFLGTANYFRKFIPNFSRIASCLYKLAQKGTSFPADTTPHRLAFDTLKQALASPEVLAYPDPNKPYTLISDASIHGCGAVLIQEDRPVAYFSSKYSSAEVNYTTTEQEMLGIIKALKEWRCYLEGAVGLVIKTDHNPLIYFKTQPNLSRRQARWMEFLSRFDYTCEHIPGVSNPADALSRLYTPLCATLAIVTLTNFHDDFITRLRAAYALDPAFSEAKTTRKFKFSNDLWYHNHQIVVPESMRHELLTNHHDSFQAGHFGWKRTEDLITRQFWWPAIRTDIMNHCKNCLECQKHKSSNKRPFGLLNPLEIPDTRWHTVTMDFIMGLPCSTYGNNAILVFVDKLTKYVHLVPTNKHCPAEECSRLFLTNIWQFHGHPKVLISDRDPRFTSDFWKSFCSSLDIKPKFSTAFHPETDGQTERANRVIEEVLRHFINGKHSNWEELLPIVAFAMNNAKSSSTYATPFYLNYGYHPQTTTTVSLPDIDLPMLSRVFHDLDQTLLDIKKYLTAAQDRQKAYADTKRRAHSFKEGQLVLLNSENLTFRGGVPKLHPKFIGPFKILKMYPVQNPGDPPKPFTAAKLELPASYPRLHPTFHVSLLKPFHSGKSFKPLPPPPTVVDGEPYYKVHQILGHRTRTIRSTNRRSKKKHTSIIEYLLEWEGYDPSHNSWEPAKNCTPDLIDAYNLKHKLQPINEDSH